MGGLWGKWFFATKNFRQVADKHSDGEHLEPVAMNANFQVDEGSCERREILGCSCKHASSNQARGLGWNSRTEIEAIDGVKLL
jgi:hypothetical protein